MMITRTTAAQETQSSACLKRCIFAQERLCCQTASQFVRLGNHSEGGVFVKARWFATLLVVLGSTLVSSRAQAPAGTTAVCNDGTYSSAPSKRGACSGHKGVQSWYGASSNASQPAPAATPSPAAAVPNPNPAAKAPAAEGGSRQVWVNTNSNVYHCQGDRNYGTTKAGQYMSEADAKAKGARPAYGKTCSK